MGIFSKACRIGEYDQLRKNLPWEQRVAQCAMMKSRIQGYLFAAVKEPPMEKTDMDQQEAVTTALYHTLKTSFGYDHFRSHQEAVIRRTLAGGNSLVIMPTGGGKSLCYQVPALLLEGITLVVSPLISLMQDQVVALRENGVSAAALNSQLGPEQQRDIEAQVEAGGLKLLYVSPERAVHPGFLTWVVRQKVALIAIDEAHCVSIWGNDFRPEYTRLTELTRCFPRCPVLALTATADAATQSDIRQQLQLDPGETFIASFERANIHLRVLSAKDRLNLILRFLARHRDAPGIVYSLSRRSTEELAQKLAAAGYRTAFYHGAMDATTRASVQAAFQRDEIRIVCATIAFGMGIDKPNIRWVIHYNLPKNVESYYQEIGRAGRDGQPAEALLFAGYYDVNVLKDFIQRGEGSADYKSVQEAKLQRLWEFTQTTSCRTNLILNYFGEYRDRGCGHCDRCEYPPIRVDGTIIAQKALSAVYRLKQQVGMRLLVDVLRGSHSRAVTERGLHQIKTWGAGADIDWQSWHHYLTQLIDQGYLGIDFTQGNRLTLTGLSGPVLKGEQPVWLCEPQAVEFEQKTEPITFDQDLDPELLEALTNQRRELADLEGKPAFTVFSNATLEDMARRKPGTLDAFLDVSGVGLSKQEKYGKVFVDLICARVPESERQLHAETVVPKPRKVATTKSDWDMGQISQTHLDTFALHQQEISIPDIAQRRELSKNTIVQHLLRLHFHGREVDVSRLITPEQIALIQQAWQQLDRPDRIKPVFDATPEEIGYEMIRYAVCLGMRGK
jgi:ATP-dependent DNA helicase RecQ